MDAPPPSEGAVGRFASNMAGQSVAGALLAQHSGLGVPGSHQRFDVATGYMNASGVEALRDIVDQGLPVRLLLGEIPSEATEPLLRWRSPERLSPGEEKGDYGFTPPLQRRLAWFATWLTNPLVEVRWHPGQFLHGKVYLFQGLAGPVAGAVGSANLTSAGMSRNLEAVAVVSEPELLHPVASWFETAWDESEDAKGVLLDLYQSRVRLDSPESVFFHMLERVLSDDPMEPERGVVEDALWLTGLSDFQVDGARRAQAILDQYGGVLIADDVGLGKTYTGGALVRRAVADGRKVLIVAPASIKPDWERYLTERGISRHAAVVTYNSVQSDDGLDNLPMPAEDVGLLVLDEAHWIRNQTRRRKALLDLLSLSGARVVALTATPVNNGFADLHRLLELFLPDDAFAEAGIPSLLRRFQEADKSDIEQSDWVWLGQMLSRVMVRRTRQFVRERYSRPDQPLRGPDGTPWRFPSLETPRHVSYDTSDDYRQLVTDVVGALLGDGDKALTLAAYSPETYAAPGGSPLSGLLRSMLLKRLESSMPALRHTVESLRLTSEARLAEVLAALESDGGEVGGGQVIVEEDEEEGEGSGQVAVSETLKRVLLSDVSLTRYKNDLDNDLRILSDWSIRSEILAQEEAFGDKLSRLAQLIAEGQDQGNSDAPKSSREDRKKYLVFTSSAVTAQWLVEHLPFALASAGVGDLVVGLVTGSSSPAERARQLDSFAPKSRRAQKASGRTDILIATDALSEGVNLQQARNVVHFDIPWNPMRAVQRAGRVDRLGSEHPTVQNYCFLPPDYVDATLGLLEAVGVKIRKAEVGAGTQDQLSLNETSPHPREPASTQFFEDMRDHYEFARALQEEDVAAFAPSVDPMDIETLRLRLREWIEEGKPGGPGRATAAVSDHIVLPTWIFSYSIEGSHTIGTFIVDNNTLKQSPKSVWDALNLLDSASPQAEVNSDTEVFEQAAAVWSACVEHVLTAWNEQVDEAMFSGGPALGKVFEEVRDTVRRVGGRAGLTTEQQDYLTGALLVAESRPVLHSPIKDIMKNASSEIDGVNRLFDFAVRRRLPSQNVAPQHEYINAEDVQLHSWAVLIPV